MLAPAKLNLSLAVLDRRPDGFHHLQTVMLSVRLFDALRFSPLHSRGVELVCRSSLINHGHAVPPLAADDRNLVLRAARLLKQKTGCDKGVRIELIKRIPMEAGMGGGSSDAAATLVALNQFWNLRLSGQELHALAAQLGSDVNFFLESPAAALCTGRGEQIQPVPVAGPLHFAVIKPPFGLSTAKVFQQWGADRRTSPAKTAQLLQGLATGQAALVGRATANDLTAPATALHAPLAELLHRLAREDTLGYGMTGSGSACYAICRTAAHARAVAGRWRQWGAGQVSAVSSGV